MRSAPASEQLSSWAGSHGPKQLHLGPSESDMRASRVPASNVAIEQDMQLPSNSRTFMHQALICSGTAALRVL